MTEVGKVVMGPSIGLQGLLDDQNRAELVVFLSVGLITLAL